MRKLSGSSSAAVVMTALLLALSGCQKQEGPAEKARTEIDKAAGQADEKVDKTAKKLGEEVEKAGEKIKDATTPDKK